MTSFNKFEFMGIMHMCLLVEENISTYTHTHAHIQRDIHIYVYKEKIQLITNKINFSVSVRMLKEEKEAPKCAKWFRQTAFCIFCGQKNQSWHLSSKVVCTQDC